MAAAPSTSSTTTISIKAFALPCHGLAHFAEILLGNFLEYRRGGSAGRAHPPLHGEEHQRTAAQDQHHGQEPDQQRDAVGRRFHQDPLAVALDEVVEHLLLAVPLAE